MGNILIGNPPYLKDSFNGAREEKDFTGELGDNRGQICLNYQSPDGQLIAVYGNEEGEGER